VARRETPFQFKCVQNVMRKSTYQKVCDDRKRRVRGLWKRGGWFYARLCESHRAQFGQTCPA
jgi:hypothetical protein